MSSTEADNIDKLYKNYDILSDAKDKISEVSFTSILLLSCFNSCKQSIIHNTFSSKIINKFNTFLKF